MADISGLIVGGIGTIAGVIGVVYAHVAYKAAQLSGRDAEESKQIAGESRNLAVEANDLARQSNNIATGARDMAKEANDIRRRSEARDTERHDVHWEGDWDTPGRYLLTKLGDDEARDVTATVVYDGLRGQQRVESIRDNGEQIVFEFPQAMADFQNELRDHQRRVQSQGPYNLGVPWGIHPHRVEERVEWTTPQGNPRLHQDDAPLTVFDGFYPS